MPSFRVVLTIGALRPGARPDRVLPTATAAVAEHANVEAAEVGVVGSAARITVRFTELGVQAALRVAAHAAARTHEFAEVVSWQASRRDGGTWTALHVSQGT